MIYLANGFFEKIQSRIGIGALIFIAVIVLLFGALFISPSSTGLLKARSTRYMSCWWSISAKIRNMTETARRDVSRFDITAVLGLGGSAGMLEKLFLAASKLIKKAADALEADPYEKKCAPRDQSINYTLDKEKAERFNARPPVPPDGTPDHPQLIFAPKKPLEKDREHFTVTGYKKDADMTTVTIPDYVNILRQKCLIRCYGLQEIHIPDGVAIEGEVFCECANLNKVRLPVGIIVIPFCCFTECRSLKTIEIPYGVKKIGYCAFQESGLVEITLPEGVDIIELSAFLHCENLESVNLPQSLNEIEDNAFEYTKALSKIDLPDGLLSLGKRAFWNSGIRIVNIPPNLTEIKYRTFRDCKNLWNIIIPDNIMKIGSEAFMGCESLKSVRLPRGVPIDETVFEGCPELKSFTVGTITVDVSHAAPRVNRGFLTAFIVKSVNMRRFEVKPLIKKEMTDSSIIDIAFQLEDQGILDTDKYVNENLDASLSVMATFGRAAAFDALVKRGARLTLEETDEFITNAINTEQHEMYLSLLRYKRDILGFDEGGESGSRFEL